METLRIKIEVGKYLFINPQLTLKGFHKPRIDKAKINVTYVTVTGNI